MLPLYFCQKARNNKHDIQSIHTLTPRVRGLTEMRKKTMQLREKPLVYPRYPETHRPHYHRSHLVQHSFIPMGELDYGDMSTLSV